MRIDVVADIVCPWSFIGVRRLRGALSEYGARLPHAPELYWRPYLLNPDVGPEGLQGDEVLMRTGGPESRVRRFHDTVKRAGAEVDIDFRFDLASFTPFALPAHRLICQFNGDRNVLNVADRLFSIYFESGCDISDRDVLFDALVSFGIERTAVDEVVRTSGVDPRNVVLDDAETHRLGINGVPSFIFAGQHVISGAHDKAVLGRMLDVASIVSDGPLSPI